MERQALGFGIRCSIASSSGHSCAARLYLLQSKAAVKVVACRLTCSNTGTAGGTQQKLRWWCMQSLCSNCRRCGWSGLVVSTFTYRNVHIAVAPSATAAGRIVLTLYGLQLWLLQPGGAPRRGARLSRKEWSGVDGCVCVRDLWFSVLVSGLSCVEVAFDCDGLLAVCSFVGCWLLSAFSAQHSTARAVV